MPAVYSKAHAIMIAPPFVIAEHASTPDALNPVLAITMHWPVAVTTHVFTQKNSTPVQGYASTTRMETLFVMNWKFQAVSSLRHVISIHSLLTQRTHVSMPRSFISATAAASLILIKTESATNLKLQVA
jgi:hypothetical protein